MTIDKAFAACMRRMFRCVGLRYSKKAVAQADWYAGRCWTSRQEDEFRDWMVSFLRAKLRWNKRRSSREVSWFLLQYGWRYVSEGAMSIEGERPED